MKVELRDGSGRLVALADVQLASYGYGGAVVEFSDEEDLRELFTTFEELVEGQTFGQLDEVADRIAALDVTWSEVGGSGQPTYDLQIFPASRQLSFKTKEAPSPTER